VGIYSLRYRWKQYRYRNQAKTPALKALYEQPPFPHSQRYLDTRFLVVDCEMSGLEPSRDQLLSLGWVVIERGRIINSTAKHYLMHSVIGAGDSTRIHGLKDAQLAGAKSTALGLTLLGKQMLNTVLVFHNATLDVAFLQRAAWDIFQCPLLINGIDTLRLEKQRLALQGKTGSLRLVDARRRYGLVNASQHNAMLDAIATAELFIAQVSYAGSRESLLLRHLPLTVM